jgi:hypothetical protein
MTTKEKNKMLLELYSLYNKSPYGEILLEDIQGNNVDEIGQKLMFLRNEGLIKFEHKPITGKNGEIIQVRIRGGITFTEKGFDYLKELRKNKLVKFREFLYQTLAPIAIIVDILVHLVQISIWLLKK